MNGQNEAVVWFTIVHWPGRKICFKVKRRSLSIWAPIRSVWSNLEHQTFPSVQATTIGLRHYSNRSPLKSHSRWLILMTEKPCWWTMQSMSGQDLMIVFAITGRGNVKQEACMKWKLGTTIKIPVNMSYRSDYFRQMNTVFNDPASLDDRT